MEDYEVVSLVRETIRKELVTTLMGAIVANTDQFRSSMQRFASEGQIGNLRNIQPYGVSSRAPANTPVVVSPIGHDPSHLNILGAFDPGRPSLNDGETILYDQYGHIVYLSQDKMQFGSKSSENPMVLGDILQTFIDTVFQAILLAPQIGFAAGGIPVFLDPSIRTTITNALLQYVDTDATNFLSQKTFTER